MHRNAIQEMWQEAVRVLRAGGCYPHAHMVKGPSTNPFINVDDVTLSNFGSNSYLGIATHPHIADMMSAAVKWHGFGSGGSRLSSGTNELHVQLERRIAEFKECESAVIFSTGTHANQSACTALLSCRVEAVVEQLGASKDMIEPRIVVFSDMLNHTSIQKGLQLGVAEAQGRAKIVHFSHLSAKSLERRMGREREADPGAALMVVTDGVFSLHGHVPPIDDYANLCERFGALLYVDDAHGTGVLGKNGHGSAEYCGADGRVDINLGTFSKALGGEGGFVAGSSDLCDYLRLADPYIFQTSMAPVTAAGLIAAIDVIEDEGERLRAALHERAEQLRIGLDRLGQKYFNSRTQIVPWLIGNEMDALNIAEHLLHEGIFAPAYRWPSVPQGEAIIRFNLMATHTVEQVDRVLDTIEKIVSHKVPQRDHRVAIAQ